MTYHGIFINLDRSPERRKAVEADLARLNLSHRYQRLRAADGNEANIQSPLTNPREIGCFLSHIWALKEGMKSDQHLHIIEDDTIFAGCTEQTLEWVISSGAMDDYDILFTDIAMPLTNSSYRQFKILYDNAVTRDADGKITSVKFQPLDLNNIDFLAASSYLINKNSLQKLNDLYDTELAQGLRIPVDLFLRNQGKVGALKIGCLFPFVTSIEVAETITSTIRSKPDTAHKFTAANIGRYTFFVECDWDKCQRLMDQYITPPPASDKHAEVLAKLLAFSLKLNGK